MITIRCPVPADVEAMQAVCAATTAIAQHPRYLFWLFATIYRERSLVATGDDGRVVAYLLSLPTSDAELILQVAVEPFVQAKGIGLTLLEHHLERLQRDHVRSVMTSIEIGYRPGEALMRRALEAGFAYRPIPWPQEADSVGVFARTEQLYRAELAEGS